MSILSQLWESAPNQLVHRQQDYPDAESTNLVQTPNDAEASDQVMNSSSFNKLITSGSNPELHRLSNGMQLYLDELVVLGKVETMKVNEAPAPASEPNLWDIAKTYSDVRDATDPETHLIRPTSYLESIPARVNLFGIPGEIDN